MQTPRPKKSLGQHFLKDTRISARIVDLLRISPQDQVLEIGPGPGALTSLLRGAGSARLVLVEKDNHWAAHHAGLAGCEVSMPAFSTTRAMAAPESEPAPDPEVDDAVASGGERACVASASRADELDGSRSGCGRSAEGVGNGVGGECPRVEQTSPRAEDAVTDRRGRAGGVLRDSPVGSLSTGAEVWAMDALRVDWSALAGPWKIISNLPYNVGSPLIWDLVSQTPDLVRGVFMVQKEVAERLAAPPGCKDYGALSVWVQSYVRVSWGFVVGPGAFAPPPKVDSAVVVMEPLPAASRPTQPEALARLLRICFQQRRKQLGSLLRRQGHTEAVQVLEGLGIAPEARPETLSPLLFQQLAGALADSLR